jgi:hypothetical protein
LARACHATEGEREKEGGGAGSEWLWVEWLEAGWRTKEGGGARATRHGATDRWGRATTGPSVSSGVQEGEG